MALLPNNRFPSIGCFTPPWFAPADFFEEARFKPREDASVRSKDARVFPRLPPPAYSSTFFLRRSTMIPRNRIANTAQTIRTIELSMSFSFPDKNKFGYFSPNL